MNVKQRKKSYFLLNNHSKSLLFSVKYVKIGLNLAHFTKHQGNFDFA